MSKLEELKAGSQISGINLQRAHLMINYDLPWNPNRLKPALQTMLVNLTGLRDLSGLDDLRHRQITEAIALQAVMDAEIALGNHPNDVSHENRGYDIQSVDPRHGRLRFTEFKGRRAGAETVTVTRNEILTAVNAGGL
jgi:hypothetical protein